MVGLRNAAEKTPARSAHLYRQSAIYARDELDLDRSTLSDWVGQAVWLLQPNRLLRGRG